MYEAPVGRRHQSSKLFEAQTERSAERNVTGLGFVYPKVLVSLLIYDQKKKKSFEMLRGQKTGC